MQAPGWRMAVLRSGLVSGVPGSWRFQDSAGTPVCPWPGPGKKSYHTPAGGRPFRLFQALEGPRRPFKGGLPGVGRRPPQALAGPGALWGRALRPFARPCLGVGTSAPGTRYHGAKWSGQLRLAPISSCVRVRAPLHMCPRVLAGMVRTPLPACWLCLTAASASVPVSISPLTPPNHTRSALA